METADHWVTYAEVVDGQVLQPEKQTAVHRRKVSRVVLLVVYATQRGYCQKGGRSVAQCLSLSRYNWLGVLSRS